MHTMPIQNKLSNKALEANSRSKLPFFLAVAVVRHWYDPPPWHLHIHTIPSCLTLPRDVTTEIRNALSASKPTVKLCVGGDLRNLVDVR